MDTARAEALLRGLMGNRIRLEYRPGEETGRSRFGGRPLVPPGFDWPRFRGRDWSGEEFCQPLAFLMQIDLGEASPCDREGLLPKTGLLSFFYEVEHQPWGFDPADAGCARVHWFPAEAALGEAEFPAELPDYCRMPRMGLRMTAEGSLPDWDGLALHDPAGAVRRLLPEKGWNEYDEIRGRLVPAGLNQTQLLGYPDVVQNPMEGQCEMVSRGIYCGRPAALPAETEAEIQAASRDWRLLLQVGTVTDGGAFQLDFGDSGNLYFWIRRQDLAAGRFDRVWAVVQCC